MRVKSFAAMLAATMLASPVWASDLSGARIEGRLGWESNSAEAAFHLVPDDDEEPEVLTAEGDADKVSYGFEAGYDALIGSSVLLGAYVGADFSDSEICSAFTEEDSVCLSSGRTFTVGVRAGVPIAERALIYVKGGYSNGKLDLAHDEDVEDEENELFEDSETLDGFHVGAGGELAFTENTYGKLEYVYTSFSPYEHLGEEFVTTADTSRHQLLFGLGLRF